MLANEWLTMWPWALIFTYGTNISKAINDAFQPSNFSKNVIIHPEVFLQYDSTSLPQNWICILHWDEPMNGDPLLPAQITPSLVLSCEKGDTRGSLPNLCLILLWGQRSNCGPFVDHYKVKM